MATEKNKLPKGTVYHPAYLAWKEVKNMKRTLRVLEANAQGVPYLKWTPQSDRVWWGAIEPDIGREMFERLKAGDYRYFEVLADTIRLNGDVHGSVKYKGLLYARFQDAWFNSEHRPRREDVQQWILKEFGEKLSLKTVSRILKELHYDLPKGRPKINRDKPG